MNERDIFESRNREELVARRIEVASLIALHQSALSTLQREETTLTETLARQLAERRYEPPKVPQYNPRYGRTDSPIDYMPGRRHPLVAEIARSVTERIVEYAQTFGLL